MALFGGEGTFNPFLGQGGVQGAAGNFAGMQPGVFEITPFAGKGEVDQTGGFLAGGGWAQPPGAGQYPSGFGLPSQLAGISFPIKGGSTPYKQGPYLPNEKPAEDNIPFVPIPKAMGPAVPGFSMGNEGAMSIAGLPETIAGQNAAKQEAYIRALEGQRIPNRTGGGFLNWFTGNMKT
jgi:hypothetical protein